MYGFALVLQIGKLNMSSVTIIYTQGQYALNLANNIETVRFFSIPHLHLLFLWIKIPHVFLDEMGMHRWTMDCHPLSQFLFCWYWNWHLESTFISVCPEHALAYLIPVKNWLIFPCVFLGRSPTQIFHGNSGNLENPHQALLEFRSSFSGKTLRCFFTHGKSLSIDPSGFSAPQLGLLVSWWEPQIQKGLSWTLLLYKMLLSLSPRIHSSITCHQFFLSHLYIEAHEKGSSKLMALVDVDGEWDSQPADGDVEPWRQFIYWCFTAWWHFKLSPAIGFCDLGGESSRSSGYLGSCLSRGKFSSKYYSWSLSQMRWFTRESSVS